VGVFPGFDGGVSVWARAGWTNRQPASAIRGIQRMEQTNEGEGGMSMVRKRRNAGKRLTDKRFLALTGWEIR